PFALLLIRGVVVLPFLALILLTSRKTLWWGSSKARFEQAGIGMLLHGGYLGGVFASIQAGLPAGLTALLVSMHPLLTAALSGPLLGVQVTARQWVGIVFGAIGVALVLGAGLAQEQTTY